MASSVVTSVVTVIPLIDAVTSPAFTLPADVATTSVIKAIYLRVEVLATGLFTTVPRVYMAIQKNPGNNIATVNPFLVGISDNRKWILHQEMTMVAEGENAIPRTMFQGVVKLPPKIQRFGADDRLQINFSHDSGETTAVTNVCIQCIYKEFR